MHFSTKIAFLAIALVILGGCKQKKKPSLSGEEPIEIADFIDFFPALKLPYSFADSSLAKPGKDSFRISYNNFVKFVPDSVITKVYGKGVKPTLFAVGKTGKNKGETYLFVKTITKQSRALFILAFDAKNRYNSSMLGLRPDNNKATVQSMVMDRTFGITKAISLRNTDGSISEGKDVFVLNAETNSFLLIMTDPLNDKVTELINPIDTLSRKHKWSGDYSNAKMNMVSIRDGRRSNLLQFFIHFEKNNGACTGELKGEATIKTANTAEYREEGDPCVLKFTFQAGSVTLKEEEGCGSRRGLNCAFDGIFARKKTVKSATKK